jgi:hypothetical protein
VSYGTNAIHGTFSRLLPLKRISVRSRPREADFIVRHFIDQQPMRLNVALPISLPLALQWMRPILDQMVEAGVDARVEPERWPWANVHQDAAGPASRLFSLICEIGPAAPALAALEPGRRSCGHRRGLRAEGAEGWGASSAVPSGS